MCGIQIRSAPCDAAPQQRNPPPGTVDIKGLIGLIRGVSDEAGLAARVSVFKPFGEKATFNRPGNAAAESKGHIGARWDPDTGLFIHLARLV